MPPAETDWWTLVDSLRPGDHVLVWLDHSPASGEVLEAFVRGALARHDLLALVLPRDDLEGFLSGFGSWGFRLDRFAAEGYLHAIPSDDLWSGGASAEQAIPRMFDNLAKEASRQGNKGISMLSKLASPFFERGDPSLAESIERSFDSIGKAARTLCLYESSGLEVLRLGDVLPLLRLHTHSITPVRGGRLIAESVARVPAHRELPVRVRGRLPAADL